MSTVKISQLPVFSSLNINPANTSFVAVDLGTATTGQFTADVLAHGLYANNILNVGTTAAGILPNTVAQFISYYPVYSQVNFQNQYANGSTDVVITASNGDNANNYLDIGVQGPQMAVDPNFSIAGNNDGYIFHNGQPGQPGGNFTIGTGQSGDDLIFFTGGLQSNNEVARFKDGYGLIISKGNLVANSSNQSTFLNSITTNTVTSNTSTSNTYTANSIITNTVTSNTSSSNTYTANSITTNTITSTGVLLNMKANIAVVGSFTLNNNTFLANVPAVQLNGSTNYTSLPPTQENTMLQIVGKDNKPTRVLIDAASTTGNAYSLIAGRVSRGNSSAPAPTQSGDTIMRFSGNGYRTTGFSPLGVARMEIVAAENFSDANSGAYIMFSVTPVGSNNITANVVVINSNTVNFANTITPANGVINTVRTYPGSQTAISVNFTTDTIVRANLVANMAITPQNFVAGRQVEVWITNTGAPARTITHGITNGTNSTNGGTTFSLTGTQTARIVYMCLDGTLANTLVAITSSGV